MNRTNNFKLEEIQNEPYSPERYDFKRYFDRMRKWNKGCSEKENKRIDFTYTYKILSELTGVPQESIRKLINKTQPTTNRDLIISMCIAIKLGLNETNIALCKYGMPMLCDAKFNEYLTRDGLLREILSKYNGNMSLDEVNDALDVMGFPLLNIPISLNRKDISKTMIQFKVIKNKALPFIEDYYFPGLEGKYIMNNYKCRVEMEIENKKTGEHFKLIGSDSNAIYIQSLSTDKGEYMPIEQFEYYHYLKSIIFIFQSRIDEEISRLRSIQNDTKNYGARTTAKFNESKVVFISEGFNYRVPEVPLYILIEDNCKEYKIYISKVSMFMSKLCGEKEYIIKYNCEKTEVLGSYNSIEELKSEPISANYYGIKNSLVNLCNDLLDNISKLKNNIKNRNEFISSLELIEGEPDEFYLMCRSLKLVKEFSFVKKGDIYATTKKAVDYFYNGYWYKITRDDVRIACELGMKSGADICRVRERVGNLHALYDEM